MLEETFDILTRPIRIISTSQGSACQIINYPYELLYIEFGPDCAPILETPPIHPRILHCICWCGVVFSYLHFILFAVVMNEWPCNDLPSIYRSIFSSGFRTSLSSLKSMAITTAGHVTRFKPGWGMSVMVINSTVSSWLDAILYCEHSNLLLFVIYLYNSKVYFIY